MVEHFNSWNRLLLCLMLDNGDPVRLQGVSTATGGGHKTLSPVPISFAPGVVEAAMVAGARHRLSPCRIPASFTNEIGAVVLTLVPWCVHADPRVLARRCVSAPTARE